VQLIHAVVEPGKVDDICDALQVFGFRGLTVLEAAGFGKHSGQIEVYRGTQYRSGFRHYAKIEIVVDDMDVHTTVEVISSVAAGSRAGFGAGKIWVTPVTEAIRISTKDAGRDAF
jgi:nitrogen regulatory protein P-II 1